MGVESHFETGIHEKQEVGKKNAGCKPSSNWLIGFVLRTLSSSMDLFVGQRVWHVRNVD